MLLPWMAKNLSLVSVALRMKATSTDDEQVVIRRRGPDNDESPCQVKGQAADRIATNRVRQVAFAPCAAIGQLGVGCATATKKDYCSVGRPPCQWLGLIWQDIVIEDGIWLSILACDTWQPISIGTAGTDVEYSATSVEAEVVSCLSSSV